MPIVRSATSVTVGSAPTAPTRQVTSASLYGTDTYRVPSKVKRPARTTARPGKVGVTYDARVIARRLADAAAAIRAGQVFGTERPEPPAADESRPPMADRQVGPARWADTVARTDDVVGNKPLRPEQLPTIPRAYTGRKAERPELVDALSDEFRRIVEERRREDVHATPVVPIAGARSVLNAENLEHLPLAHAYVGGDPKRGDRSLCGQPVRSRDSVVRWTPNEATLCPECLHATYLRAQGGDDSATFVSR